MVRLVLFDIDGTLIHSGGAGEKAFAQVARIEFNLPAGTKDVRFAGRTDYSIVREMFQRHGIEATRENFTKFFDSYVFWLDHLLPKIPGRVLPRVGEWIAELQSLSNPPLLGLLTGNIRLGAQIKLTHYRLWHHFGMGGFSDDSENRCEIAAIARDRGSALLDRKLAGDEVLVIGDTPHDIECGQSIGARVLAVGTGSHKHEDMRHLNPTWCVPSLEAVSPATVCA
jgi:phosphoglycolate phosphatase-like HAD superfamily hydrolase